MLKKIKPNKAIKIKNKKAVSLMISYVILISIAITLSLGVYTWLKVISNPTPAIDCKEGTSLILDSQECISGEIELTLKNNGRFNIDGVIVSLGENTDNQPTFYPMPDELGGPLQGHYHFSDQLKPQQTTTALFSNQDQTGITISTVEVIQIQPFILKDNQKIICQNAVIKQEISNCNF